MRMKLKEHGKILTLRKFGKSLRSQITEYMQLNNDDKIIIDFDEIDNVTHSFIDELIAKLFWLIGKNEFKEHIEIINANEDIKRVILFCIQERAKDEFACAS